MQTNEIAFRTIKPPFGLNDFVESFWMISNVSGNEHQIVVLPDGRFDIIFSFNDKDFFQPTLKGLDIEPKQTAIPAKSCMYAVSLKMLAIEYLLDEKVASLLNGGFNLANDFWGISKHDFTDFNSFCEKVADKMISLIKPNIDKRKKQLFDLIYLSNGTLTVKELSEKVFWSPRQINRYFTQTFGISLKSYCNIFRFRSSLTHIKKGKLFPELNFTDQTHFIKEVKKMSGVTPKELSKNTNDRFILLSAIS
ncbi:MAG: AraC family transcriptional regulator [Chitinophagaceae bacterium]|nr:AraC family transcriptional regulator [Chitinophagaceae bacterium]